MFGNIDSSIFLLSPQCYNTESIMKGVLCHICVWTLSQVFRKACAKFKYPAE